MLGDRSSVRQSRFFRQYESGNNVKSLLGTDHLRWDPDQKEGVFSGHAVYDGRAQQYDYDSCRSKPAVHAQPAAPMPLALRVSQAASSSS